MSLEISEIDFHYRIGTIIACEVVKEYAGTAGTHYKEAGNNYLFNKCQEAEKCAEKLSTAMSRDLKAIMPHVTPIVEHNMQIVYDVLALEIDDQKRIQGLIKKIKNGK